MRISDWSSDVCSSDLDGAGINDRFGDFRAFVDKLGQFQVFVDLVEDRLSDLEPEKRDLQARNLADIRWRSEEHTSELQSLMRISYAVFCLKKKILRKLTY